jgi:mono/diheme cytochrome c family protein
MMSANKKPVEEKNFSGWFFIFSLLLVVTFVWVVHDETVTRRPWKKYQEKFNKIETGKIDEEIKVAREKLNSKKTQKILSDITDGLAEANANIEGGEYKGAEKLLAEKTLQKSIVQQNLIFLRSERDEAFYYWKHSIHKGDESKNWHEKFNKLSKDVQDKEDKLASIDTEVDEVKKQVDKFHAKIRKLEKNKQKIYGDLDRLTKLRDAVLVRGYSIRQLVIPELDTVDRCQTCHLSIDRCNFTEDEIKNPFRTHPEMEKILGKVHPPSKYGCTICHHGQGRQIKGIAGRPFDHGRSDHYWEEPMLKSPYMQMTCRQCHKQEWEIEFAPVLNKGKKLFADMACYGCHTSPDMEEKRKIGPTLNGLAGKTNQKWLYAWLSEPESVRARTKMPNSWPTEDGSKDKEKSKKTKNDEIIAVSAFLLSQSSDKFPAQKNDLTGDPDTGKKLFVDRGCIGCHRPNSLFLPKLKDPKQLFDYGPDLSWLGSKIKPEWIATYVLGPRLFYAETRMPKLAVSNQDGAHIAAFLTRHKRSEPFAGPDIDVNKQELAKKGKELVLYYGCFGCHEIESIQKASLVGPDLTGFGQKSPELLAFGDAITDHAEQTWMNWVKIKLESPRIFTTEKSILKMSDANLNDQEVEALIVYMMSLREPKAGAAYMRNLTELEYAGSVGSRLITFYNCRGCHKMDGEGGNFDGVISDAGLVPPLLTGEGQKTQPPWLYRFLKSPLVLRPWMTMQMPNFDLSDQQAEIIVKYFMQSSEEKEIFLEIPKEPPPEVMNATADIFIKLKCVQCHKLDTGGSLKLSDLAPDMTLTRERLRPEWMEEFITDPQWVLPGTKMPTFFPLEDDDDPDSIMTPFPDWMDGDAEIQVAAIRDYLYYLKSQSTVEVPDRKPEPVE